MMKKTKVKSNNLKYQRYSDKERLRVVTVGLIHAANTLFNAAAYAADGKSETGFFKCGQMYDSIFKEILEPLYKDDDFHLQVATWMKEFKEDSKKKEELYKDVALRAGLVKKDTSDKMSYMG